MNIQTLEAALKQHPTQEIVEILEKLCDKLKKHLDAQPMNSGGLIKLVLEMF